MALGGAGIVWLLRNERGNLECAMPTGGCARSTKAACQLFPSLAARVQVHVVAKVMAQADSDSGHAPPPKPCECLPAFISCFMAT